MTGYDPTRYGELLGDDYDALYPGTPRETEAAVAMLADLAERRPRKSVLEFGIGTGRLALDLRRRGLIVAGIDASERMVAQLRRKPGGDDLQVVVGDYRTAEVPGAFSVVALVFNNILDPRGRPAQLDIFRNAGRHLEAGGCFVIEAFVLNDAQRSGEWSVIPRYVASTHVELQLARYDVATNRVERTFVHLRPEGLDFASVSDAYASPGELDVMAEATGFELSSRFATWSGEAFTAASARHVSVYELVDPR
jgi:SAM-dependent methyltransferase